MNRFVLIVALAITVLLGQVTSARAQDTTRVLTGELGGSPYRMQVPPRWNHNLVLFDHWYLPRGTPWSPMSKALAAVFLDRGFAVAEPGYSRQGWAVEEGLHDTEVLRRHFATCCGRPDTTFIVGFSMGGALALAAVERYPKAYAGALPVGGPLVSGLTFFRDQFFDMLVTFDALFGRHLPREYRPVLEARELPEAVVDAALQADSALAQRFGERWTVRRADLPGNLSFNLLAYRELVDRAGGNPIDNRNTIYVGFGDDRALNDVVMRRAAEPRALAYVLRHTTPSGVLEDPVLALHTTYDPDVPQRFASGYQEIASCAGSERLFVLKRVEADGHCNVSLAQLGKAFDELRRWAATGVRPEAGVLR